MEPRSSDDPTGGEVGWNGGPRPGPPRRQVLGHPPRSFALALLLFLATIASTWLTWGPAYSASIMTILLCHEMGHYLFCRRYGVPSTLPLFLPLPWVSPFGTLGAIILMRRHVRSRRRVFDIGIAGPLAGLVPSVAACIYGLARSTVVQIPPEGFTGLRLGDSLLFRLLQHWIQGPLPAGSDLMLHPIAYAGWAGVFVTSLNLIPIGQLDGGHIVHGLLGRPAKYLGWLLLGVLAGLAMSRAHWWVLVALLVLVGLRGHPPTDDDHIPLGRHRVVLGILAMVILILTFTPTPIVPE
jgi:membrane-associated protease RseP (regulator of RpoE activity)